MNKEQKIALIAGIALFLAGFFTAAFFASKTSVNLSGNVDTDFLTGSFTSSAVNVSSTAALVLDLDAGRQYAEMCLDSTVANLPVYLSFTATSTGVATSTGKPIVSYGTTNGDNCFKIGRDFKYPGQVWAISATSTAQKVTILKK